jgi:N-acetylmuramoyl-L-alanine amidase
MACAKKPSHIAVDCGHGGADSGTVGVFGYAEKQVTLNVGLELARLLKDEGFQVTLTRAEDIDMDLDERTTLANKKKADLLVSIHANNAPNKSAQGVETFCMDSTLLACVDCSMDAECKAVACERDRQRCLASNKLANTIHQNVLACANAQYAIADRSVRKSVSQMLLGAAMPSILIEVGFLSNSHEAQLLGQTAYQKLLAQGICDGIKSYAHHVVS